MVQKMVGPVRSLVIANPAGRSDWKECTVVTGIRQGSDHVDLSVPEAADRLAIRELVDAYAYCADRRDVAGQMALFTDDTELVVFADSRNPEPTQRFRGRAALAPVFSQTEPSLALPSPVAARYA